jgi:hypothetical protein
MKLKNLIQIATAAASACVAACGGKTNAVDQADIWAEDSSVHSITVEHRGEEFRIKAFGYRSALAQAQGQEWTGSLAVKFLTPTGAYHRSLLPWVPVRIEYDYTEYTSPEHFDGVIDALSPAQNAAIVFLAPPGTFGSSGSADRIYHEDAAAILSAAIDELIQQTNSSRLTVAGASVSGNLIAHLLTHRRDIDCAIISSAPLDLDAFRAFNRNHRDYYPNAAVSSPMSVIDQIQTDDNQEIRVGFSATDEIVPERFQRPFYDALQARGVSVTMTEGEPIGSSGHTILAWESRQFTDCN